ncbi:MAG: hypothetical protein IPH43_14370 [Xanthomonadales bacterium]|nr:hypothetical protein [Xanthomonadales bacterium]
MPGLSIGAGEQDAPGFDLRDPGRTPGGGAAGIQRAIAGGGPAGAFDDDQVATQAAIKP